MWARGLAKGAAFDAARVEPAFAKLLSTSSVAKVGGAALVPGCGRGYAVAALARAGMKATGLEIAPSAVEAARAHLDSESLPAGSYAVDNADFFEWKPSSKYDLIYDCTFLCAIPPERRGAWAEQMEAMLAPDGTLVTLIFPVRDPLFDGGPPYCMSLELVRSLLQPRGFAEASMREVPAEELARGGFVKPNKARR